MAYHSQGQAHAPDMTGNMSHAIVRQDGMQEYSQGYNQKMPLYNAVPQTAPTWDFTHAGSEERLKTMLYNGVEKSDGWWFKFAPVVVFTKGFTSWTTKNVPKYAWNPAAESTAPRLVQVETQEHQVAIGRFNLGAKVKHENYLTPEGQEELFLKLNAIASGLVVTQKLGIGAAICDAKLYYREQNRLMKVYVNLADALQLQKNMYGAMSKDPLGLHKILANIPEFTKFNPSPPDFNMCVVPEGAMAHYKYGSQSRYHTDASLRGEKGVDETLSLGTKQFKGILDYPVFEDKTFTLSNLGPEETNMFKRRTVLGQYAILEHNDHAPPDMCGPGMPSIEIVTMPTDDWTRITLKECLDNCPRFSKFDGSIFDFTQPLIDSWDAMLAHWGSHDQNTMIDPWIVPYKKKDSPVVMQVAEFIGEQDVRYRSEENDVQVGECADLRVGLSESERATLRTLMMAADYLYDPPPGTLNNRDMGYLLQWGDSGNITSDEWGGPAQKLTTTVDTSTHSLSVNAVVEAALNTAENRLGDAIDAIDTAVRAGRPVTADEENERSESIADKEKAENELEQAYEENYIAWGWGDIFMVMSLLSKGDGKYLGEFKNRLNYADCKFVLTKLWDSVKRIFPSLVTIDDSKVPSHRRAGGALSREQQKDRNAMISTFRGLLERIKHPVWTKSAANPKATADTFAGALKTFGGGGTQGSIFDSAAFNATTSDAADTLNRTPAEIAADAVLDAESQREDNVTDFITPVLNDGFTKIKGDAVEYATLKEFYVEKHKAAEKEFIDEIQKGVTAVGRAVGDVAAQAAAQDAADDAKGRVVSRFVGLINGVFQMSRIAGGTPPDWRGTVQLNDRAFMAMEDEGENFMARGYDKDASRALRPGRAKETAEEFTVTKLTLSPATFGQDGNALNPAAGVQAMRRVEYAPTDPYMPTRALFANAHDSTDPNAVRDITQKFARARFGQDGQEFQDPIPGIDVSRVHGELPYGREKEQYMGAERASEIGGAFLRLLPLHDRTVTSYEVAEREHMSRRQAFIKHHMSQNPVARLMAFCYMLSKIDKKAMMALMENGVPVPMNFALVSPFINIDTEAIMFAEGGSQTATTGLNLLDISLAFDSDHKEWNVHASARTGTRITDPQKILLLEDVLLAGYKKGLEHTFFRDPEDLEKYDITRMKASIFCIDLPITFSRGEASRVASPLNLFGGRPNERLHSYSFKNPEDVFMKSVPDFPTYFAYQSYWHFGEVNRNNTMDDASYRDLKTSDWIPGTCWPTRIRTFNPQLGIFELTQRGAGELDDIPLPMRQVLDGKIVYRDLHANT